MAVQTQQIGVTGTIAEVKGSGSSAQVADNAVVVALSPNSPLPPGANVIGKMTLDQTSPGVTNAVSIASLNYPNSTGNNSSVQLAAGATFTGAVETVLSLQAAQIEIVCDQNYTVTVNQFIDAAGLQLSNQLTFTRTGGTAFCENITLPGNYFQLKVQNTSGSPTTTLTINTTFGIMANDVGTPSDPASTNATGRWSINSLLKGLWTLLTAGIPITAGGNTATVKAASTAAVAGDPALVVAWSPNNNVIGNAAFEKITDGTNTAKVQAASTASAAADTALVVTLSPNSPLPATTSANQALSSLNVNASGALTALKASAGNLFGFSMQNGTAAVAYLEFWNVAAGSVTLGTTAPTCVFILPASGSLTVPPGLMALMNSGTAMSYAVTSAYNGAVGTVVAATGSLFFK